MQLVHEGDARAFEVMFDRHGGPAFSLAYRMCGRRAMAIGETQRQPSKSSGNGALRFFRPTFLTTIH